MKARIIVGVVVVALALAGSSIAFGSGGERRIPVAPTPAGQQFQQLPSSLAKTQRAIGKLARVRIRCRTLGCVDGALSTLAGAFKAMNNCMSYIDIARYDGYTFSNDGGATDFQTTALDEVSPGEPATHAVVFIC